VQCPPAGGGGSRGGERGNVRSQPGEVLFADLDEVADRALGQEELQEGLKESLNHVPRLARGSVRKILFG